MKFINAKRSYDGWAIFALLGAIGAITATTVAIITTESEYYSFVIPFMFFVFFLPSLYFIDIFLWHFFGEEIITVNETELEIRKTGRLFKKKKKIKLYQIRDIYLWQKKIRDIHIAFSFWDISWQGTLCIKYKRNKKYYIGMNMTDWEASALRDELMQDIKRATSITSSL